jgi:hypothetical protein
MLINESCNNEMESVKEEIRKINERVTRLEELSNKKKVEIGKMKVISKKICGLPIRWIALANGAKLFIPSQLGDEIEFPLSGYEISYMENLFDYRLQTKSVAKIYLFCNLKLVISCYNQIIKHGPIKVVHLEGNGSLLSYWVGGNFEENGNLPVVFRSKKENKRLLWSPDCGFRTISYRDLQSLI